MDTNVVVALISFAGTLLGALLGIIVNTKLSNYRIEQLEKKVDAHNQIMEAYVDRTYKLEKEVGEIRKDINHIYHEIDEIKK